MSYMTDYQRLQRQITYLKEKYACLLNNTCTECDDTTPTEMAQDNVFMVVNTSQVPSTNSVPNVNTVVAQINADPAFEVGEFNNVFFKVPFRVTAKNNIDFYYVIYKMIGLGKGTYGSGATSIGAENLLFDSTTYNVTVTSGTSGTLPAEVFDLETTQFATPHLAVNNSAATYVIDATKEFYFQIFNDPTNKNQIPVPTTPPYYLYLWTGAVTGATGTFGNGGTSVVAGDFQLIDTSATETAEAKGITVRTIDIGAVIGGNAAIPNDDISKAVNRSFKGNILIQDHEIVKFGAVRKKFATKLGSTTQEVTFTYEKYDWRSGLAVINSDSVLTDFDLEYSGPVIATFDTGVDNEPEAHVILNSDIDAPQDALNASTVDFTTDKTNRKDFFIVYSPEKNDNVFKVYEFIGADATYGASNPVAILGDFSEVTQLTEEEKVEAITKTSQLFNDGDGVNPYLTTAGAGMLASTYDPTAVNGDAFLMSNMAETATRLVLTDIERAAIITNSAKVTYPTADSDKVAFISVTQAVDLDTMESNITTNNAKNSYPGADSTKVGFISVTQAVNLDTMESDIALNNAKLTYPAGDATKMGHISVTQAVDLDAMEAVVQVIKEATVTITAAELKDLLATPKEIIPAQGANTVVKLLAITGFLDYGTTAFDFTENLEFNYETSGIQIMVGTFADWNGTADQYFDIDKTGPSGGLLSPNEGITLSVPTTDATTGDSDVKIVVLYAVQDFSI